MHVSDIEPGTVVQIVAARGVRTMEFDTKVIEVNKEELTVKVEPTYRDNKLVGFDIAGVVLALYVPSTDDSKVFQFNNIKIHSFKDVDDNVFQEISFRNPQAKMANRRGACRVWIGIVGTVLLGNSTHEHAVTIKDISATGISFVCDDMTEVEMGMPIVISFTDDKTKKSFMLGATVVRYADAEHRRIVYGCRFKDESSLVSRYVNEKQREKLKVTRNVEGIRKGYGVRPKD